MIVFTLESHPSGAVLIVCGPDGNGFMARFGPAQLSRPDGGYLCPPDQVQNFLTLTRQGQHTVIDSRGAAVPRSDRSALPLPESQCCGIPRRRHRVGCAVKCDNPEHDLPALRHCANCGEPWVDFQYDPGLRYAELRDPPEPRYLDWRDSTGRFAGHCATHGPQLGRYRFCARCGVELGEPLRHLVALDGDGQP